VHRGLGGIFTDDAIYHYLLFAFGEPALLPAEPTGSCGGGGGHEDVGKEPDDESEESLKCCEFKMFKRG